MNLPCFQFSAIGVFILRLDFTALTWPQLKGSIGVNDDVRQLSKLVIECRARFPFSYRLDAKALLLGVIYYLAAQDFARL